MTKSPREFTLLTKTIKAAQAFTARKRRGVRAAWDRVIDGFHKAGMPEE